MPAIRPSASVVRRSKALFSFLTLGLFLLGGCGVSGPVQGAAGDASANLQVQGSVFGGQQPIADAVIQLYAVGTTGDGSAATPLISSTIKTSANGGFKIDNAYTCPGSNPLVYITAKGGNPGLTAGTNNAGAIMLVALGRCNTLSSSTFIFMNELTTLGSIYPLAPFMTAYDHIGSDTTDTAALSSAFAQVPVLVNTTTGNAPGATAPPNGFTVPVSKMNTLADATAACINSAGGTAGDNSSCGNLFTYSTPPSGSAPTDVAQALANIANFPYRNVPQIFNLQSSISPFQPVLSSAPSDWTVVTIPSITLAASSTAVGAGGSATGTITLGAAAPASGLTVTLTSSDTGILTVTSPVTIPSGQTTGSFTYTGVASGSATVTASAPSYSPGSVTISPLGATLRLADPGALTPGTPVALSVSLSSALPSATTVTLAVSNANPSGVVTISPTTVTIPAGATTPTASPVITPNQIGTATVTASAPGLNSASRSVSSTVTATLASPVSIGPGASTQTLTLSTAAPTGGVTFTLASSNTAVATVPASVTVPAGNSNTTFTLTGVAAGTANITASSYNITTATSAVTVVASITANTALTGFHLQTTTSTHLNVAPQSAVSVTVTSSNPAVAVLSKTATAAGSASITFTGVTNTSDLGFYVQGLAEGTTTYTVTASGFTASNGNITVNPAGFYIRGASTGFTTTTASADNQAYIQASVLDPSSHNELFQAGIIPQIAPLTVALASSNTAVITVVTQPSISAGSDTSPYVAFHPTGVGTATINLAEPTGFTVPVNSGDPVSLNVTVNAPAITSGDTTTGVHTLAYGYFSIAQNPTAATTFTVTVGDPSIAGVSKDASTVGTGTTTFTGVTSSGTFYYTVQGIALGQTTVTVSAPGYSSIIQKITVKRSAVYFSTYDFSTTTFSQANNIQLSLAVLEDDGSRNGANVIPSPNYRPLSVTVNSSNTAVGTAAATSFNTDSYAYSPFTPASAGTTTLSITQPAGFTTPGFQASIVATVTAPPIDDVTSTSAVHAQVLNFTYLGANPPSARTVTLTVADPSIVRLAANNATVGTGTLTFTNVTDTSRLYFWVQGQAQGSTTVTITCPGYATQTSTITVYPSGFYLSGGNFTTSVFSGTSTPQLSFAALAPGSFNPQFFPILNPDVAPVSVTVTSSNTSVGTIASPATFQLGDSNLYPAFTPVGVGTTTLTVTQPAGFSAASYGVTATVTVTPGSISYAGDATVGSHLQLASYFNLNQTPPSPRTVTMTIADTSIAVLSASPTVVGSGTLTYTLSDTTRQYPYIQGKAQGTTTVTISAPGYTSVTFNVTVERSGFIVGTGNATVAAGGSTYNFDVDSVAIRADGYIGDYQPLSPDVAPVSVSLSSSNPTSGTAATVTLPADSQYRHSTTFTSGSAGQTTITVQQPSGFTVCQQSQSFTVTVQ